MPTLLNSAINLSRPPPSFELPSKAKNRIFRNFGNDLNANIPLAYIGSQNGRMSSTRSGHDFAIKLRSSTSPPTSSTDVEYAFAHRVSPVENVSLNIILSDRR